jgi:hypothetical protein
MASDCTTWSAFEGDVKPSLSLAVRSAAGAACRFSEFESEQVQPERMETARTTQGKAEFTRRIAASFLVMLVDAGDFRVSAG